MVFLVLSGNMLSVFPANMILSLRRKMKDDLPQKNTFKYDIFFKCSVYTYRRRKKKKKKKEKIKDDVIPQKYTSRWLPKYANKSLFLYGDIYRRFHILLSSKKKTGNLIYRIEVWLFLQCFWLEIFYNEEYSILCTIQPTGVVSGGVLEPKSRKLFDH